MAEEIKSTANDRIQAAIESIRQYGQFVYYYGKYECFRIGINRKYNEILNASTSLGDRIKGYIDVERLGALAPQAVIARVWRDDLKAAQSLLEQCLNNQEAATIVEDTPNVVTPTGPAYDAEAGSIFDKRLERLISGSDIVITPYDTRFQDSGTTGFIINEKTLRDAQPENEAELMEARNRKKKSMENDPFYAGVASVVNPYSLIKLYGSNGGQSLVDRKDQRRWYEIDSTQQSLENYSLNPTTTAIINWGEGDPYGRTPYSYSDFVFCKYWNIVPNNRLITLRRYPAPIVDNLKFAGMDGFQNEGSSAKKSNDNQSGSDSENLAKTATTDKKGQGSDNGSTDQGTGKKVDFPPMATAVTYFGEETGNQISEILKFTTGVNWGEVQSDVWEPTTMSNPDMEAGPGGISPGLAKWAKMLNIATGNYDTNALLNKGNLPPDPYKDGPYENRIIGPVNAITSVAKRERGIKYENDISLTFEYVARPIGGINTKAVLLDIISNFLIIGSATAMFWGGQHRFMGQPQTYPFMGGDEGIQKWYRGDPVGWGETAIDSFANKVIGGGGLLDMAKNFFGDLLGGGKGGGKSLKDILTGDNIAGNIVKAKAAAASQGTIPYLTGLKALLIGEPVGEWHITVGNPLNPIAMIGNLICDSLEVEFGNELGPDDFPLDVKITANLKHGMARDRDAIQSMFNRGMGRIYDLPDGFIGTADSETKVDKVTGGTNAKTGRSPKDWRLGTVIGGAATSGGKTGPSAVRENAMNGSTSVWNPSRQFAAISPNENTLFFNNTDIQTRSEFRAATWVSLKSTT